MKKLALTSLLFCGCIQSPYDPEVVAKNQQTLQGKGTVIGTMLDGRTVRRYEISMGAQKNPHWIYVIDGSDTMTLNFDEPAGKSSVPVAIVIQNDSEKNR